MAAIGIPIISDILGYISNSETNATNQNIATQTNLANYAMAKEANASNYRIAQNTNAMNQAINEANIQLQREQNAINREREDNAVRRRVNDLVGAGLSKTLAAGSAASANAMQAPQATLGMQTGNAMKAAHFEGARMNPYRFDNLASVGRMIQEERIADRELDIREQELEEAYRHNKATEGNTSRGLDLDEQYQALQDKWHQAELDQNSTFHDDAVRLQEASLSIQRLDSWSQRNLNAIHELWYQADIDLMKLTGEQNAARLTADLAESAAKVANFYASAKLSSQQAVYLKAQIPYIAASTAEAIARKRNLNAQTQSYLADVLTKMWNLSVAVKDNGKTNDTTVSSSVATENKKGRFNNIFGRAVSGGLAIGAGIFFKSGGGNFFNKMLGMDDHGLWSTSKNH